MKKRKKEYQDQPAVSQNNISGKSAGPDAAVSGETAKNRGETNNNSYTDEYDNYCPWS